MWNAGDTSWWHMVIIPSALCDHRLLLDYVVMWISVNLCNDNQLHITFIGFHRCILLKDGLVSLISSFRWLPGAWTDMWAMPFAEWCLGPLTPFTRCLYRLHLRSFRIEMWGSMWVAREVVSYSPSFLLNSVSRRWRAFPQHMDVNRCIKILKISPEILDSEDWDHTLIIQDWVPRSHRDTLRFCM